MAEHWTVNDLMQHLGVSRSTIQRRADRFLAARRTDAGHERLFSAQDVAVMVEVDRLVRAAPGASFDEIETNLDRAQFEAVRQFPRRGQEEEIVEAQWLQLEARAQVMIQQYQDRAAELQQQLDAKEAELMEARLAIARLEERVRILTEQGDAAEVRRLIGEIAVLEFRLKQAQDDKEK